MKDSLKPGLSAKRQVKIDDTRVIGFMGEGARVYATPSLVMDIEHACRDLLLEHLDEGFDSVGTRVEINHIAATLLGMNVEISVTVSSVEGRAVIFDVSAHDDLEEIGNGRHSRFVVDVEKTFERLQAKSKKAGI